MKKILVVDDEKDIIELIEYNLKKRVFLLSRPMTAKLLFP